MRFLTWHCLEYLIYEGEENFNRREYKFTFRSEEFQRGLTEYGHLDIFEHRALINNYLEPHRFTPRREEDR